MARDFEASEFDRIDWSSVSNLTAHALTVSYWVYLESLASNGYILCIHDDDTVYGLIFNQVNSSLGYQGFTINGATDGTYSSNENFYSTGAWIHVLITWDGTNGASACTLYKNGVSSTISRVATLATETTHTGKWSLGGRYYDDARNFDGLIAEVGVWSSVLDAGTIAALASGIKPSQYSTNLVYYYSAESDTVVAETGGTGTNDGSAYSSSHPAMIRTLSKSEGVTLGESVTVQVETPSGGDLSVSVSDGVTLGEARTATLPDALAVSKSEGVTLGEAVAASVAAAGDLTISVADTIALGEAGFQGWTDALTVSKSEGVTLGEVVAQRLDDLAISKSEGVTLGEAKTATLPDALTVSKSEGVTLGEVITQRLDDLAISKSEGVTVGEAASADLRAAWYNPDVLTVNIGSVVSGTIEDTWSDNGVKLQLAETTGTPGFDYDFIFYNVPADAYSLTINGYYQGNAGHNVKIRQYNFTTLSWTDLSPDTDDFPSTTSDQNYQFALFGGANYNSGGEVRLKIIHTSAGSITHNFYIDRMLMSSQNLAVHMPDEGVTLGESYAVALADLAISKSEGVTLGEAVAVQITAINDLSVSVTDTIALGEVKTAAMAEALSISKSEGVTLGESSQAAMAEALQISKSEGVTLGEATGVVITAISDLSVSVTDGVTVADTALAALADDLAVSVTDGLTILDVGFVMIAAAIVAGRATATDAAVYGATATEAAVYEATATDSDNG